MRMAEMVKCCFPVGRVSGGVSLVSVPCRSAGCVGSASAPRSGDDAGSGAASVCASAASGFGPDVDVGVGSAAGLGVCSGVGAGVSVGRSLSRVTVGAAETSFGSKVDTA